MDLFIVSRPADNDGLIVYMPCVGGRISELETYFIDHPVPSGIDMIIRCIPNMAPHLLHQLFSRLGQGLPRDDPPA